MELACAVGGTSTRNDDLMLDSDACERLANAEGLGAEGNRCGSTIDIVARTGLSVRMTVKNLGVKMSGSGSEISREFLAFGDPSSSLPCIASTQGTSRRAFLCCVALVFEARQ